MHLPYIHDLATLGRIVLRPTYRYYYSHPPEETRQEHAHLLLFCKSLLVVCTRTHYARAGARALYFYLLLSYRRVLSCFFSSTIFTRSLPFSQAILASLFCLSVILASFSFIYCYHSHALLFLHHIHVVVVAIVASFFISLISFLRVVNFHTEYHIANLKRNI